jgi:thermitase
VEYAHLNCYLEIAATPNDPFYLNPSQQWYLYKIKAGPAWDYSKGAGVKIAVIDTGIWADHPDLDAKITVGYDFVDDDAEPEEGSPVSHGTHVAGIAAAETNNAFGMASLGWDSTIIPLKVTKFPYGRLPYVEEPEGDTRRAVKAVYWAVLEGKAHIINMSFSVWGETPVIHAFEESCGFAYKLRVVLAAGAGNRREYGISYPAKFPTVIAVGAIDRNDKTDVRYAIGPQMELCAPGIDIISTAKSKVVWDGNQYSWAYLSGTSMAAPLVSATAALCRAKWPEANAVQIRTIMQGFSDDLGPPGKDDTYGFGRVNPYKILSRAEGLTLEEVVAAAEDEIAERLELGAYYGQYIDKDTAAAVYGP